MNITFIIGNGFDLNLDMRTKYSDMYNGYLQTPSKSIVIQNFKNELANRKPYDKWSDFEMGMSDYAKKLSSEKELIECVRDFKTYLVWHLRNENTKAKDLFSDKGKDFTIVQELNKSLENFYNGLSPNVINEIKALIGHDPINYNFLTFNYTSTLEEALLVKKRYQKIILNEPLHIHGTLDNDIVLGIDNLEQLKDIKYPITIRGQRNFIKTVFNDQYDKLRVRKAKQIIQASSIICVYGWSMGNSDQMWVELLREWIITHPIAHLVYYQYNSNEYYRYNFDEIMDAEDDAKEKLMQKLGLPDEMMIGQIHVPIGCNIFNFGKVKSESIKTNVVDEDLFMAINT